MGEKMRKSTKNKSVGFIRLIIFILLVSVIIFIGYGHIRDYIVQRYFSMEQGTITINNLDSGSEMPIKGAEFTVMDQESGEIIETLITNLDGQATSALLDYERKYKIKQTQVPHPYNIGDGFTQVIELNEENYDLFTKNTIFEHVKDIERTEDGEIIINEVLITVPTVMQKPELPNGCEITSLTAVLNHYGYDVSKTTMSDKYLRKQNFDRIDGKLYGADPFVAFAGEPRDERSGFYVYAPPIVEAADEYFSDIGALENHRTKDISGSSIDEIYEYLKDGVPVVIWTSIDQQPIRFDYSWYLFDSGEFFKAATNLHAVVLTGYVDDKVHVMDPLEGQITYTKDIFFEGYFSLDSQAMIVY